METYGGITAVPSIFTVNDVIKEFYNNGEVMSFLGSDGGMWINLHSNQWQWWNGLSCKFRLIYLSLCM